jgi:hypothetical protein
VSPRCLWTRILPREGATRPPRSLKNQRVHGTVRPRWAATFIAALLLSVGASPFFFTPSSFAAGSTNGLPNPTQTPGAIDHSVTQANIHQTICVSGYSKTVRPPESYTEQLKRSQLRNGYSVQGVTQLSQYEEDHLISLEIGGSPTAVANLWPEAHFIPWSSFLKDKVENKLHAMICSGQIALATAQHEIASNWEAVYISFYGTPSFGPAASSMSTGVPPALDSGTRGQLGTTGNSTASQSGCNPVTSTGKCYRSGEYCSAAEHGVTGIAGDSTRIACVLDGSRWRWEPAG